MIQQPRPRTMFEKIWDDHVVVQAKNAPAILYIDFHLIHEVTSPQAFTALRHRGLRVRCPERTMATMDHSTPTTKLRLATLDNQAAAQLEQLTENCRQFNILLHAMGSPMRGIVHVIGPELGLTQPGMTIVCGDSHTSTHGAFGALSFGIGTSEVEHVLATQCLLQNKPRTLEIRIEGRLANGVSAKDIILALISKIGIAGATGHVIEYTGSTIRSLNMEERMTVCNMSIEAGARAGMVAPDDTTFEYIAGRDFAPTGNTWDESLEIWRQVSTDEGASHDSSVTLNAATLEPMITYGTNPGMGMGITDCVPDPMQIGDLTERQKLENALAYMELQPGQTLIGKPVDVVFIGSCTNGRISDLRLTAEVLRGRRVYDGVRMLVVPGSQHVQRQAEAEGLDEIFKSAGAEWRESGCSMCIAMNDDKLHPGEYAVSTSNRNFEGRQGKGSRTFLASPLTAAATAVNGAIADVRDML